MPQQMPQQMQAHSQQQPLTLLPPLVTVPQLQQTNISALPSPTTSQQGSQSHPAQQAQQAQQQNGKDNKGHSRNGSRNYVNHSKQNKQGGNRNKKKQNNKNTSSENRNQNKGVNEDNSQANVPDSNALGLGNVWKQTELNNETWW